MRDTVFEGLKETFQSLAQDVIDDISSCNFIADSDGSLTIMYRLVSSAKRRILLPIFKTMSLIKIKNKRGPNIDPWGTPALIFVHEDVDPGITTRCRLLDR